MTPISRFVLLLVFGVLIGCEARAQTTTPYRPVCEATHIDVLMGTVSLSLAIDRVVEPTLACLMELWKKDNGGRTHFYISNAFLSIAEANPQAFFSIMAKEPKLFTDWLGSIGNLSFTWPFDPPCGLERKRKHLISVIRSSEVPAGKEVALKDQLIGELLKVHCRQLN